MASVKKVFYLAAVLGMSQVSCKVEAKVCSKQSKEASHFGMMLQRHIFKRMKEPSYICLNECRLDLRCQSINYVISKDMCELNNRTKEARPEDFVPDPDRYYFKREFGRVPLGSIPELPAESCHEINASEGGQAVSGTYWFYSIIPDKVALAYCDMKTEDLDECNSSIPVCHVSATCQNTIGSYRCLCSRTGFIYRDGEGCVDAEESAQESQEHVSVNADCNNTAGSHACPCKPTYFGNGNYCISFRGLGSSVILGDLDHKNYTEKLISFLEPVLLSSQRSGFVRCWHAKTDGSAASIFHDNCDGKGPTVTIIKYDNFIFGGYTDVSWRSTPCDYSTASKAFIFSLYNTDGYNPVKLTQYQNQEYGIYGCSNYGPTFGSNNGEHDIFISGNVSSNAGSYANCGGTYSVPSGYSAGICGFFTGGHNFTPTDIEVFYEIGDLGASAILGSLDFSKYLGKLISYLDPVVPDAFRSEFVRCWHAKTDGSAASTFHNNCDGKGPTVTIIKAGNYIFGGYTDLSWQNSGGYTSASKAFIFSLYNVNGYNPVKLTQYQNQQYAMYKESNYGPSFGYGPDIYISDNATLNKNSSTQCGGTYSYPSGYSTAGCEFFTGGSHFTPTDIEVFYEIGGLGSSVILGDLDHDKYLMQLIRYLDPVLPSASRSYFVRCWHAKTDGSAASIFHSNCDGKGPTVTIIKVGQYIFGGYTDRAWQTQSCKYSSASKAFLFSLYNKNGYNPVKLTQYLNQHLAIYSCPVYGPTFGHHSIYISNNALSNSGSYTSCGYTYSVPTGYSVGSCGFFTGGHHFTPTDIEVFYEIGGLVASAILGSLDHSKYLGKLLTYLDPAITSVSRSYFVRCWRAKTDGSAASTFHSNCDGKGPTVTIIRAGQNIFGGYTDVSWHSSCTYSTASKAFIFSLYNTDGYNPVKLTQYRYRQYAIFGCSSYGPTFGSNLAEHDIYISGNVSSNAGSHTNCGGTYYVPSGYSAGICGFFTGGHHFTPTDIEVFYEIGLSVSVILRDLDYNKYLGNLLPFLSPVLLRSHRNGFVRCWHAKTDGSAASTFHSNCDGKGPTVTIIKYGGYIFGAYTDVSWNGSRCNYTSASKAFLFSLYNIRGSNPVKLTQYQYQQYAMFDCSTHGPTFGADYRHHDIYISNNALTNAASYTTCGATYSVPLGYSVGKCGFFTGGYLFTPTDIEVFYEIGV